MGSLRALRVPAHLQVSGQSPRLQMEPVFVGSQPPPLHFLVVKFKLHLRSRGDVYFGFEVFHIQSPAPRGLTPQHESARARRRTRHHIHAEGTQAFVGHRGCSGVYKNEEEVRSRSLKLLGNLNSTNSWVSCPA